VGESETPILGELNPPKDSKILRRNQEISKGGLGVTFTVELERERAKGLWMCIFVGGTNNLQRRERKGFYTCPSKTSY
jgi:hypothetical protein